MAIKLLDAAPPVMPRSRNIVVLNQDAVPSGRSAACSRTAALSPTIREPRMGKLPRGVNSLPQKEVEAEQRIRLVLALARVVAAKGYADTSVADVIGEARASRATFYKLFKDKEDCFLYGFHTLSRRHLEESERALLMKDLSLPERLLGSMQVYVRHINQDMHVAQAFIAEAQGASPQSRDAFNKVQRRLQGALSGWWEEVRALYPMVPDRSVGDMSLIMSGLNGHVIGQVRLGTPFTNTDVAMIVRFMFAGLGLYGWAKHVDHLAQSDGSIFDPISDSIP